MSHLSDHVRLFMEKCRFPQEAKECFEKTELLLDNDTDFGERMDRLVNEYMFPQAAGLDIALKAVELLANEKNVNVNTLNLVFLMNCTEILLARYRERGISEEIYWDTMDDFRCKLLECMACEGVPGIFVPGWYHGFFEVERFALGRFQFERTEFNRDEYKTQCGYLVKEDMTIYNFHIPSSGISLTQDVRLDSYKRAYEFFKNELKPGEPIVFCCSSWLLYPPHREFLPPHLHILEFMSDFEIIDSCDDKDKFSNGWRVFGKDSDLPTAELPEKTALQRAYKKRMLEGKPTGNGFGLIVFDGKKILR